MLASPAPPRADLRAGSDRGRAWIRASTPAHAALHTRGDPFSAPAERAPGIEMHRARPGRIDEGSALARLPFLTRALCADLERIARGSEWIARSALRGSEWIAG